MPYNVIDLSEACQKHMAAVAHKFWPEFQKVLELVSQRDGFLPGVLEAVWSKDNFVQSGRYAGIWFQTFREEHIIGRSNVGDLKYLMDELSDMLMTARLAECSEEETPQYFEALFRARAQNYFWGTRKQISNTTWKYVITTMLNMDTETQFRESVHHVLHVVEKECPEVLKVALADWLFVNKRTISKQQQDLLSIIKEPTCAGMIAHVLKESAS